MDRSISNSLDGSHLSRGLEPGINDTLLIGLRIKGGSPPRAQSHDPDALTDRDRRMEEWAGILG